MIKQGMEGTKRKRASERMRERRDQGREAYKQTEEEADDASGGRLRRQAGTEWDDKTSKKGEQRAKEEEKTGDCVTSTSTT